MLDTACVLIYCDEKLFVTHSWELMYQLFTNTKVFINAFLCSNRNTTLIHLLGIFKQNFHNPSLIWRPAYRELFTWFPVSRVNVILLIRMDGTLLKSEPILLITEQAKEKNPSRCLLFPWELDFAQISKKRVFKVTERWLYTREDDLREGFPVPHDHF